MPQGWDRRGTTRLQRREHTTAATCRRMSYGISTKSNSAAELSQQARDIGLERIGGEINRSPMRIALPHNFLVPFQSLRRTKSIPLMTPKPSRPTSMIPAKTPLFSRSGLIQH